MRLVKSMEATVTISYGVNDGEHKEPLAAICVQYSIKLVMVEKFSSGMMTGLPMFLSKNSSQISTGKF